MGIVTSTAQSKDWLAQYQDNVTTWDIRSWCWQPGLPMLKHYKAGTLAQIGTHPVMTLDVARL